MSHNINCVVLHRLVKSETNLFEDINLKNFIYLINNIRNNSILSKDIKDLKADSFILTFDDGNKSDIKLALPILKKNNLKAIFFIVPKFIGKKGFMNWDEIKILRDSGMEIGSHSLTHPNFTKIDYHQKLIEIKESKKIIENKLNIKVNSFAFPFGFFDKESEDIIFQSGYQFCFNSKHGINNSNTHILRRNSINCKFDQSKISNILNPTKKLLFYWFFEDLLKSRLKLILGDKYNNLRNWILDFKSFL